MFTEIATTTAAGDVLQLTSRFSSSVQLRTTIMLAGVAGGTVLDHQETLAAEGAKRHDNQGVLAE